MKCTAARLHRARSPTATATSAGWRRPPAPRRPRPRARPARRQRAVAADGAACTQPGCSGHDPRRLLRRLRLARRRRRRRRGRPASPTATPRSRTSASQVQSAAIGSKRARRHDAPPAAPRTGSQRMRAARLGAGLTVVPAGPAVDAAQGDRRPTRGARGQAHLLQVRQPDRPRPSTASPAAPRASAPSAARSSRSRPSCKPGDAGRRAVRGRRRHRPRRPRLDLPGQRPQRLRPLGGAQGPAQLRRPRRARGGDRRAAVPGPGRAPADRRDLQLRDPRGRGLHRHGVRRRHARSSRSSSSG